MRPMTFDQAWIKDGRKLTRARASSGKGAPLSDDDYPAAYHNYLKSDNRDLSGDKTSHIRRHRGTDVEPSGRSSARAAVKGLEAHAKNKGNLLSFAKQHKVAVDVLLNSLSPRGVLSGSKSIRSSSTATTASTPRSLYRAAHATASSWSSDDSDFQEERLRDVLRTGFTPVPVRNRSSSGLSAVHLAAAPTSVGSVAGSCAACGRGHACSCGAYSSRTERLAVANLTAAAAAVSSDGQYKAEWPYPAKGNSSAHEEPVGTTGGWCSESRCPDAPPPESQLSFQTKRDLLSSSSSDEPATPRVTWYSYLSPGQLTGKKNGSGMGSSLTTPAPAAAVAGSRPRSSASAASAITFSDVRMRRMRDFSSSGGGSSGRESDSIQSRAMRCFGSLIAGTDGDASRFVAEGQLGSQDRQQPITPRREGAVTGTASAGGSAGITAVHRNRTGRPYGRRLASDISTSTDESEQEEEQVVQKLLGQTAAWVHERQQQRLQQQELAALCQAARRRACIAVLGTLEAGASMGTSFTSWLGSEKVGHGTARGNGLPHSARAAGGYAGSLSLSAPTSLAQRRLGSYSGGDDVSRQLFPLPPSKKKISAVARSRIWRDAAVLVTRDTSRRRTHSPGKRCGRSARGAAVKALSDSSEESFAYRMASAAITLRSISAPRYGRRHYDSASQVPPPPQQQGLLDRSLSGKSFISTPPNHRSPGIGAAVAFKDKDAAASPAGSVISSAGEFGRVTGDGGSKARGWLMTEVLRTPVGRRLADEETPPRGYHSRGPSPGGASSPWTESPWAPSPSQKLNLSRVWGPAHRRGYEGLAYGDGGGVNGVAGSPPSAAVSDDML